MQDQEKKSTRLNSSHTIISYAVFCDWSSDVCSRSEEHTSELQSHDNIVCRLLFEKKKINNSASVPPCTGHCRRSSDATKRWPRRFTNERLCLFFFNDTATTEIYTLSLHDALPT